MLYLVAVVACLFARGFPPSLDGLIVLIAGGLLVATIGESRTQKTWVRIVVDWLPLVLLLIVYDVLRKDVANARVVPQLRIDDWLAGGVPLTWRIQHALFTASNPHW